jgi:N-acetyltransferase
MLWSTAALRLTTLIGQHAALVPLELGQLDDLTAAVQDGELWRHWYTSVPAPGQMQAEIERRLDLQNQGSMQPFAVIDMRPDVSTHGKAVGMTTYMNMDAPNRRLEIGSTWYAQSVQRSAINTECKLMLLTHAFEEMSCIAVEFRTHWFNQQSRAAIERLGAKLDGVLRNHSINTHPDAQWNGQGALRDTCVYSIIASEWSSVRAHLKYRLAR